METEKDRTRVLSLQGKSKRKEEIMHAVMHLFVPSLTLVRKIKLWGEKKRWLFFSINNSFRHIGDHVKLDSPGENGVQRRMTRNNEEILPQTPSPADWMHESTHEIKNMKNS